jgi:hypothetical protein
VALFGFDLEEIPHPGPDREAGTFFGFAWRKSL